MNPETAPNRNDLLEWYYSIRRELPWRHTRDPYRIWLSEVMLQQTRVDQALPYYERFVSKFPDIQALADAARDDVLRIWEGLGYYSRARNLHKAARQIVDRHGGRFPDNYEDAVALQGVGSYTAAAVLSIAFNQPYAVVDGNVTRVVCRLYAIDGDIRKTKVQKEIQERAEALLDSSRPGDFNQAIMELGATVCTPAHPECHKCPWQTECRAYQTGRIRHYPFKSPAKKRPHHDIAVGLISDRHGRMFISRRPDDAMLGGLWEFPGGKREKGESLTDTVRRELREELGVNVSVDEKPFEVIRHAYSHFTITLHAFFTRMHPESPSPVPRNGEPYAWVPVDELGDYAFPKANRKVTDTLVKYHTRKTGGKDE